jgi:hypothetical protein
MGRIIQQFNCSTSLARLSYTDPRAAITAAATAGTLSNATTILITASTDTSPPQLKVALGESRGSDFRPPSSSARLPATKRARAKPRKKFNHRGRGEIECGWSGARNQPGGWTHPPNEAAHDDKEHCRSSAPQSCWSGPCSPRRTTPGKVPGRNDIDGGAMNGAVDAQPLSGPRLRSRRLLR